MQNKKEAISITIDKDLIEMLAELEKREGRSRSAIINAHLKHSLPYALGKKPLHEAVEPTTPSQLIRMWRDYSEHHTKQLAKLEKRIEKLEKEAEEE